MRGTNGRRWNVSNAEEALKKTEAELDRVVRVTTMGELAASIAHEVNQPLAAIVTNGNASLRWLSADPPNFDEAREAIHRIIRDGNRASEVIARIRALLKKGEPVARRLDCNEIIREIVALMQSEVSRRGASLQTALTADLRSVMGDRVQLQQVLLNRHQRPDAMRRAHRSPARRPHLPTRGRNRFSSSRTAAWARPGQAARLFDAFYD